MNKYFKIVAMAVIALFIATSCTVEQTIDFNEDMSGKSSFSIDMSEMMDMIKAMQPDSAQEESLMGDYNIEEEMKGIKEEFDDAEGLSNFNAINDMENGFFGFTFDFEDVKYITDVMNKTEGEEKHKAEKEEEFQMFQVGKKSLIVDLGSEEFKALSGASGGDESTGMEGFSMGDFKLTLNFPFQIKSVNNEAYMISEDKKSVSLSIPLEELADSKAISKTEIKW